MDSGHGRMTVFRSGPGYSSKKTYDFGPDGVVTKTEENSGDRINGDMRKWCRYRSFACIKIAYPVNHDVKVL